MSVLHVFAVHFGDILLLSFKILKTSRYSVACAMYYFLIQGSSYCCAWIMMIYY